MKRMLAASAALALILSLSACGDDATTTSSDANGGAATSQGSGKAGGGSSAAGGAAGGKPATGSRAVDPSVKVTDYGKTFTNAMTELTVSKPEQFAPSTKAAGYLYVSPETPLVPEVTKGLTPVKMTVTYKNKVAAEVLSRTLFSHVLSGGQYGYPMSDPEAKILPAGGTTIPANGTGTWTIAFYVKDPQDVTLHLHGSVEDTVLFAMKAPTTAPDLPTTTATPADKQGRTYVGTFGKELVYPDGVTLLVEKPTNYTPRPDMSQSVPKGQAKLIKQKVYNGSNKVLETHKVAVVSGQAGGTSIGPNFDHQAGQTETGAILLPGQSVELTWFVVVGQEDFYLRGMYGGTGMGTTYMTFDGVNPEK